MKQNTTMPMVLLSAIIIGKTNPRKVFDEDAINELAQSIKQKGVIQPILLRPVGDSLELVCGERRYRASMIAGLTEIPAYVRTLTDDEALEAQITENLQRKDVHPMDEAYAFKQLLEKYKLEEVAAKVGKKDYFIRQRMKLNDLTPEWQKLFYKNLISISDALKISMLPIPSQKAILDDEDIDKTNIDHYNRPITINDYQFRRSIGKLKDAPFDTASTTIDKKAGACTLCTFNSAFANLFPEATENPLCNNLTCFTRKCDVNFDIECKKAIEDPTITFISGNYSIDRSFLLKYKKGGTDVLTSQQYEEMKPDYDEPDWEEFKEDREDEFDSEQDMRKAFDKDVEDYKKEQAEIEKMISTGKCIKAFFVDGKEKGKYTYIQLRKVHSKGASKNVNSDSKPTAADIDSEIGKIREREKRSKELDGEKVQKLIVEAMKQDKLLKALPAAFTPVDRVFMCFLIAEYVDFGCRDIVKKVIGFNISSNWGNERGEKYYKQLEGLTDEQLAFVIRTIIFQKYNGNLPTGNGGYMVRKLAELIGTVPITDYEADQKVRAEKRQRNVDKRIAELQEQKKELKPKPAPKPKAPAKAAPKKAAKK